MTMEILVGNKVAGENKEPAGDNDIKSFHLVIKGNKQEALTTLALRDLLTSHREMVDGATGLCTCRVRGKRADMISRLGEWLKVGQPAKDQPAPKGALMWFKELVN